MLGDVPVRVAVPPVLAAYATARDNILHIFRNFFSVSGLSNSRSGSSVSELSVSGNSSFSSKSDMTCPF